MESIRECHGCKAIFPYQKELDHYQHAGIGRYGVASPECLAAFFDILAKESELFGYPPAHRLVVDAYAIQHPSDKEWQEKLHIDQRLIKASIKSIPMHLMALHCAIDLHVELPTIAKVMGTISTNINNEKADFAELAKPKNLGAIKAIDIKNLIFAKDCTLDEYTQYAWNWARSAWNAWESHHTVVRSWYEKYKN